VRRESLESPWSRFGPWIGLLPVLLMLLSSCAGRQLEGKVAGIQTRLQSSIADGSKTIGCAPKETALAEANIKFAEEALRMGEYFRGNEHVLLASKYTEIAELKTDEVRCRAPGQVVGPAVPTEGDRDGDGYADAVDECPDEPEDFDGFEDEDGCPDPDNDGDGIPDVDDQCPDEPEDFDGFEDEDGCPDPDNDGDGIPDVDDKCPNEPEDFDGFEDEDGCPDPDNDGDGIPDVDEKCPNEPEDFDGFEDEDGCPDPDNDGDGIPDELDQCPNDPEDFDGDRDEDGCPDLAAKVDPCAIKLDDKIMFDFGKSSIDSVKFGDKNRQLLDEVYQILKTNPDITIEIGGHTDSKGSDKSNQKLSQRRVESVREYLVGKGVDPKKLTAKGYGESVPVDTNRTAEGRENNRRVEFNRTDNPECNR
jgi:OmpA-OmpF porin, OOP family